MTDYKQAMRTVVVKLALQCDYSKKQFRHMPSAKNMRGAFFSPKDYWFGLKEFFQWG